MSAFVVEAMVLLVLATAMDAVPHYTVLGALPRSTHYHSPVNSFFTLCSLSVASFLPNLSRLLA